MKRTRPVLIILSCLLVLLAGCQAAAPTTAATTAEATTAATGPSVTSGETTLATEPADVFPVTIQDALGHDITIQNKPQSIIVTNVWGAEMLFGLVESSRIKGLSAWGDDPAISAAAEQAKAVTARVKTGDPEGIIALKPDLVILDTFSDPDGSLTQTLTGAGAVVLQMQSPTTFDQIRQAISVIAAAVGESAKGRALIAEMDATLQTVAAKLAGLTDSERKTVLYYEDYYDQSGSNAGMLAAYGKESPFEAIATAAGLVNVCNAATYSAISKEMVVGEWKPDLLIVPAITYTADFKAIDDQGASLIAAIRADKLLQTLPAVQNGQIFALTEKYRGSTSQYMAMAVAELAAKAYPDLFK
jgi:iron complex transport system substrate-binding protein